MDQVEEDEKIKHRLSKNGVRSSAGSAAVQAAAAVGASLDSESQSERDSRNQEELMEALGHHQRISMTTGDTSVRPSDSMGSLEESTVEEEASSDHRREQHGQSKSKSRRRRSGKKEIAHLVAAQAVRRKSSEMLKANLDAFEDDLQRTKHELLHAQAEVETIQQQKLPAKLTKEDYPNQSAKSDTPTADTEKIREKELAKLAASTYSNECRTSLQKQSAMEEEDALFNEKGSNQRESCPPPPRSIVSSSNSTLSDHNDLNCDNVDDDMMPPPPSMPALQRGTGRELLPETQPGAVSVRPTHYADDPSLSDYDPREDGLGELSTSDYDSDGDSSATPEIIPDSLLQGIPQATPIRASIVRQEEESKEELERLQRQMQAKQREMQELQTKLAEMERMKLELQNLKAGVAVAEPVAASLDAPDHTRQVSTASHVSTQDELSTAKELEKERAKAHTISTSKTTRPKGMSEAEYHAYQVLIGNGPSSKKEKTKSDNNKGPRSFFTSSSHSKVKSATRNDREDPTEMGQSIMDQSVASSRRSALTEKDPPGEQSHNTDAAFAKNNGRQSQNTNKSNSNNPTKDVAAAGMSHETNSPTQQQVAEAACCVIL